jgi:hypothetical protein
MREIPSLMIVDNFCPSIEAVKASAFASGFGKWTPNKGMIGSSIYAGMNFQGLHAPMVHSLSLAIGRSVYPNSLFFRVTNADTEKAYTHSDREAGDYTCICYLTEHKQRSGTGFYRHRATGLTEMPCFSELKRRRYAQMRDDIVNGGEKEWEETAFVTGLFNRAVIFRAPLFHARFPRNGFGKTEQDGRVVHVIHFHAES